MAVWNKGLKGFNRPKRQARYTDLLSLGFTRIEAQELSAMPRSIPYLRELVQKRAAEHSRYIKSGKTESEWVTHIKRRYPMKGYGTQKEKASVWAMLRETEKPWKEKHPEYMRGYPKKSHHKDGEKTSHKLLNSMGKRDYSGEIADLKRQLATFGPDAVDMRQHLEQEIRRLEHERG